MEQPEVMVYFRDVKARLTKYHLFFGMRRQTRPIVSDNDQTLVGGDN
jgi:hypothetical protein